MYMHILTIEYSLQKPQAELGDSTFASLFNRVPSFCPVLHLFGQIHLPTSKLEFTQINANKISCNKHNNNNNNNGNDDDNGGSIECSCANSSPQPLPPSTSSTLSNHKNNKNYNDENHTNRKDAQKQHVLSSELTQEVAYSQHSACVHVHGVYPYFLVPQHALHVSAVQFAAQLEAVAIRLLVQSYSYANNNNNNNQIAPMNFGGGGRDGRAPPRPRRAFFSSGSNNTNQQQQQLQQLIQSVEIVHMTPFYGYHANEIPFYKVSVIDPALMEWLMGILHETTVVGNRKWEIYEGHIPFHAQFMDDYEISGIAPLHIPRCQLRLPSLTLLEQLHKESNMAELQTCYGITQVHDIGDYSRLSRCEIEIDIAASTLLPSASTSTLSEEEENSEEAREREHGANLAHIRRTMKSYFADYHVSDELRVASTMTHEEELLAQWQKGDMTVNDDKNFILRYGDITQIQRNDAVARRLRRRMTKYLTQRLTMEEQTKHSYKNSNNNYFYSNKSSNWKGVPEHEQGPKELTHMNLFASSPPPPEAECERAKHKYEESEETKNKSKCKKEEENVLEHKEEQQKEILSSLPLTADLFEALAGSAPSCDSSSGNNKENNVRNVENIGREENEQEVELLPFLTPLEKLAELEYQESELQEKEQEILKNKQIDVSSATAERPLPPESSSSSFPLEQELFSEESNLEQEPQSNQEVVIRDKSNTRHRRKRSRVSASPESSLHHATQRLFSDSSSNDELCYSENYEELLMSEEDVLEQEKSVKRSKHQHQHHHTAYSSAHEEEEEKEEEEENLLPSDNSSSLSGNRNNEKYDVIEVSSSVSSYLTVSENNTLESFTENIDSSSTSKEKRANEKQHESVFSINSLEAITQDANVNTHDKEIVFTNNEQVKHNEKNTTITTTTTTTTQDSVQLVAVRNANEVHFAELLDKAMQRDGYMTMYSNIDGPAQNNLRRCFIIQSFTSATHATDNNVDDRHKKLMVVRAIDPRYVQTLHWQKALITRNEEKKTNGKSICQIPSRIEPSALLQYTCVRSAASSSPVILTSNAKEEKAANHKTNEQIIKNKNANNNNNNPFQRLASSMRFSAGRSYALQCTLKVLCVEVCVKRTAGMQSLSSGPLYAVALGFTSSTSDDMNVKVVCVVNKCNSSSRKDAQVKMTHNRHHTNKKMYKKEGVNDEKEYKKLNVHGKINWQRSYELSDHVVIVEVCDEASLLRCVAKEIMNFDPDLILSWDGVRYGYGLLALRYQHTLHKSFDHDLARLHLIDPIMSVTSTKQQSSSSSSSLAMLRARNASRIRESSLQSVTSKSQMKSKTEPNEDNNNIITAVIKEDVVKQEDENESETEIVGAEEHGREENSSSELFTSASQSSSFSSSSSSLSSVMSYHPEEYNDNTNNYRNYTKNNNNNKKSAQGVEVRRRGRKKKLENNISHIDKSHLAHKQYVPGEDIPTSNPHTHYSNKTINRDKKSYTSNKEEMEMQNTNAAKDSKANHDDHNDEADATHTALRYARRFGANVKLSGRVCLSLSKTIRKELKVPSYTLPMVYQSLFNHSLPYFSDICLTAMYFAEDNHINENYIDRSKNNKKKNNKSKDRSVEMKNEYTEHTESYGLELYSQEYAMKTTVFRHLVQRVLAPHRIARHLHHYSRTMEFSRMYGILFNEVITRGSQFQVEATLRRLTWPQHYALLSPTRSMVRTQPRIKCIPLILQPKCDFYSDPILVLDFRSLYPSIVIAYNLCYSTCVGRVQRAQCGRLGVVPNYVQDNTILREYLSDDLDNVKNNEHNTKNMMNASPILISPNGAMFVQSSVRRGILPEMLKAVLDTRFELQAALKHIALPLHDTLFQQRLEKQQQALKMLANVTYGYTGASHTGRMPCVDLAEAIVSLARQTLERAIALVHGHYQQWKARVVYGDTDSLFIHLPHRTRSEAFAIGNEIASAVTASNPLPIRLQMEKVLQPCFLIVKKRYVGFAWFKPDQTEPQFFAKGIETVRRDQCSATSKLTENLLKMYMTHYYTCTSPQLTLPSLLYQYYTEQVGKLQRGDMNPYECIFRRAVKLGHYRSDAHLPLGAHLALQLMEKDLAHTPFWGERVPYVVTRTVLRTELKQKVVHPVELIYTDHVHKIMIDAEYYIHRHINAALDRIFYLIDMSFAKHYAEMCKKVNFSQSYMDVHAFVQLQRNYSHILQSHAWRWELSATNHIPLPHITLPRLIINYLRMEEEKKSLERERKASGYISPPIIVSDDEDDHDNTIDVEDVDEDNNNNNDLGSANREAYTPYAQSANSIFSPLQSATQETHKEHKQITFPVRTTLDAYYPRTLCVVCESNYISLEEHRLHYYFFTELDKLYAKWLHHVENDIDGTDKYVKVEMEQMEYNLLHHVAINKGSATMQELNMLSALPAICTECWASPVQLLHRIIRRYRIISTKLHVIQQACQLCIAGDGTVGGPGWYMNTIKSLQTKMKTENYISDVEDLCGGSLACTSVPHEVTSAIARENDKMRKRHTRSTRHHNHNNNNNKIESRSGRSENRSVHSSMLGCTSIDCPLTYEKARLTLSERQLRSLQWYLQSIL